ncbi:MAG: LlaJI family restriction endonuclease [Bacillota bacterium]
MVFKVSGILIYKNTFIFVFPKGYKIPKEKKVLEEHIRVLFSVLLKYRRDAQLKYEEVELLGGDDGEYSENILTAYRLIKDFTSNGFLIKEKREKISTLAGNIDWVSTINKKQPIFSGKSVIYTETISRKRSIDRQNLLLKLHKYCIFRSVEKYGWLLGLPIIDIEVSELPCDIRYALNFLQNELNNTFVERELKIIKEIKVFLSGIEPENNEDKIEMFVTPYFYIVWELICGDIFSNQYKNLKMIIPKLKWEIESSAPVKTQRPDIMILKDNKMLILDAKYYNVDNNLPGWSDIVKQLFYSFTISNNIKSKNYKLDNALLENKVEKISKVENYFLFPSGDEKPIKYIGKVNIENNSEFEDIKAYKINTFLAMKCYIGNEKYNFISELE